MAFPAFLDTCVLYPATLADLLLRIAEREVYQPHWSADVMAELERNLSHIPSVGPAKARHRIRAMTEAFPEAPVMDYSALVSEMTCDPKDRHVLAAATRGRCQVIVTFNLKDFPPESLAPHDITAVSPDDFLLDQLDLYPAATLRSVREQAHDARRPRLTPLGLLASLERTGAPRFVAEVRRKADTGFWTPGPAS